MGKTITQLLVEMSSAELAYWELKYGEEYLGSDRGDWQAGVIASAVANYAGKCLKEHVTVSPGDFMLFAEVADKNNQTPQELNTKIKLVMNMIIGRQRANGVQ